MIIGKVLVELKKTHLRLTDKLVGIDDQEKKVKDLLAIDANDVRKVVGLWGMGGIGKTTLAKFIYNQILDKFESCSFLNDIREKSSGPNGLKCLQSQLVSDLSKQERRDFSSVDEGVNELKNMFHEMKVLILLDDVDHIDQFEALAANVNWFGPGSRIIITTRNRSILNHLLGLADDKDIAQGFWWAFYEVKEMNIEKALQLFCKHSFRQDSPEDELCDLSHAIVETTGGLPLALEVIGSYLSRKTKPIWVETLERLKKMPKREVQERLKISYDRLDDDQKQMFLNVACHFIGEDIYILMHVWKYRDFCALLVMSLIKIVDNKIWMHDQLRDLGREIFRKENYQKSRKRIRLWQENEARAAIANNSMVNGSSSEVKALALGYSYQDGNSKNYMTSMGSKKQNGYEVFLSFMGDDTRKGFVDHLYEKMVDAGIMVFKDNVNLPDGEEISTSLSKAIELSKIAIPIFSKNYANSRWCLDELVCMLECRNTMVLPIFYDVTPSQVKHQKESYATAFDNHANTYDKETREKWRKALADVTSLKGLELGKETGGLEGQLTKKILAKVLVELKKNHLRITDKLVGIDDQEKKVKDLLAIDANDVRKVVGLWGMGGIGKTTLAKFIYNQILDKFDSCSFLNDIREKSLGRNGLECLQSQLVSDLSRQRRRDFRSVDEGVNHLEYMFRENKVLILLDDVDNINQLEALAANTNWFGPGSRIIVTTRNRSILDDLLGLADDRDIAQECWWACYEVKEMDKKKSLQLFCRHAFRQEVPEDKLSDLSHAIVDTTGGLPLALEVIGSCLSRKRISIWEETLEILKKMPKLEVQERLKISYERLDDDQKQMFLDVACLFIGEDIDIVMHVWKSRDFCAEIGKDALLVMSLIKIIDNKIWMHDQLRDLGREIVRKENYQEPGKRCRLLKEDEARAAIANNSMVCGSSAEVEALTLHSLNQDQWITSEQLRNYPNIWFLRLYGVNLTGDFQHLLSKLRWLRWSRFSEECPPTNINMKKLLFLDLSFSSITDDWKLWNSFQSSMKLKILNLKSCTRLTTLDVSMFIDLERLALAGCSQLKEISVGKIKSLKMLDCGWCQKLHGIEGLDQLEALEELNLSCCRGIIKLPSISKLKSLKRLNCSSCLKLQEIEGLDQLEALEDLNLSHCEGIIKLPSISRLKSLKRLNCSYCLKLQEIEGLDQLEALEDLNLSHCRGNIKLSSICWPYEAFGLMGFVFEPM